jgi:hypothetical protein
MEHNEQIQLARPSGAASLPAPSAAFSRALKSWLALFSEHYRQEISELSAVGYLEGLGDLTAAQLDLACAEARARMQPRGPGSRVPDSGALAEVCPSCQGLGWRIEPRTDGEGNWAVRCGCGEPRTSPGTVRGETRVKPQMNTDEH